MKKVIFISFSSDGIMTILWTDTFSFFSASPFATGDWQNPRYASTEHSNETDAHEPKGYSSHAS